MVMVNLPTAEIDYHVPFGCRKESQPVLFNEDDHFRFTEADNHMMAALGLYVSWGYFEPGKSDYVEGYQCRPVNWGINTERKKQFFAMVKEITGS